MGDTTSVARNLMRQSEAGPVKIVSHRYIGWLLALAPQVEGRALFTVSRVFGRELFHRKSETPACIPDSSISRSQFDHEVDNQATMTLPLPTTLWVFHFNHEVGNRLMKISEKFLMWKVRSFLVTPFINIRDHSLLCRALTRLPRICCCTDMEDYRD